MIFGACHHQVMVARRLVYRETHHRPNVATQLPDGLQPEVNNMGQPAPSWVLKLLQGALPGRDPHSPGAGTPPFLVMPGKEGSLGACQHPATEPRHRVSSPMPTWQGEGQEEKQGSSAAHSMRLSLSPKLWPSSWTNPPTPSSSIAGHHPLSPIGKGPESPYFQATSIAKKAFTFPGGSHFRRL